MDARAYALVGAVAHSLQRKEAGSDPYVLSGWKKKEAAIYFHPREGQRPKAGLPAGSSLF